MKLLTGNSNKVLSKNIAKYLRSKLINSSIRKFSDGEIYVEINENIRGNSIFIIQSVSSPANDNLMELLLCIDALKRSSAKNITAVIPYFGYARQDRKVAPRTSISAKVMANLITNAMLLNKPQLPLQQYTIWLGAGLVLACLSMTKAPPLAVLILPIFLLQCVGQRPKVHIVTTRLTKLFTSNRLKAVAVASLAHSLAFPHYLCFLQLCLVWLPYRLWYFLTFPSLP